MNVPFTLLFLLAWKSLLAQSDDCILKKSDDKIFVYTCKAEGARFKSLKATFTIANTTLDELVTLLKQVENFPKWQYKMTSAKILKQVSDSVTIVRSEIDAPWPAVNRELIVEYSFEQNKQEKEMKVITKTTPYDYPVNDELVRVPFSHAEWKVKAVGNDLQVSYMMQIDPGGSLPAWVVNMAMADGPHHTFVNLKKMLE